MASLFYHRKNGTVCSALIEKGPVAVPVRCQAPSQTAWQPWQQFCFAMSDINENLPAWKELAK